MKSKILFKFWKGLLPVCLWVFSIGIFAQSIAVSGTVRDDKGEPLIGVTIQIKGISAGTVTDINGGFSLSNIPPNSTLVFSYIGKYQR